MVALEEYFPQNNVNVVIYESWRRKYKKATNRRKAYMRNIIYEEYNIERDDKDDGCGNYENPWY